MKKTNETDAVLESIREGDMYDGWGVCLAWMFATADYLTFVDHTFPPAKWEYRSSPFGADTDNPEFQTLMEHGFTGEEMEQVVEILSRWYSLLLAAGKDY